MGYELKGKSWLQFFRLLKLRGLLDRIYPILEKVAHVRQEQTNPNTDLKNGIAAVFRGTIALQGSLFNVSQR